MRKIFLLAFALAVAFSFLGVYSLNAALQPVPVTLAQPAEVQSVPRVEPKFINRSGLTAPTPAPTRTALPTQTSTAPASIADTSDSVAIATTTIQQTLLDQFIQTVTGQNNDLVTGVYIPDRFSLPVLQQPPDDPNFVSTVEVSATQFRAAAAGGTIGLLAHNYLSGKKYFDLVIGDEVVIVYGSGKHEHYQITKIDRFQALSPTSPYSDFIDLSDPSQTILSAGQVFQREYTTRNRVVFQTCIEANGDPSWGRIFVIADKVSE